VRYDRCGPKTKTSQRRRRMSQKCQELTLAVNRATEQAGAFGETLPRLRGRDALREGAALCKA
jgi:hypothetical protein